MYSCVQWEKKVFTNQQYLLSLSAEVLQAADPAKYFRQTPLSAGVRGGCSVMSPFGTVCTFCLVLGLRFLFFFLWEEYLMCKGFQSYKPCGFEY